MQPKSKVILLILAAFVIFGICYLKADLPTPLDLSPLQKTQTDETQVVYVQSPQQPTQTYVVIREDTVTTIYNVTKPLADE